VCNWCGTSAECAALLTCVKCGVARYCSKDCQKADWKEHRKVCSELKVKWKENVVTPDGKTMKIKMVQLSGGITRVIQDYTESSALFLEHLECGQ
jgi:hypothetical protein